MGAPETQNPWEPHTPGEFVPVFRLFPTDLTRCSQEGLRGGARPENPITLRAPGVARE